MVWIEKYFNFYTVIIIFIATALLYNHYNPLWCSPDEERHFGYCEFIAQKGKLPVYTTDTTQYSLNMGFHPPLYYLAMSLLCAKNGPPLKEIVRVSDEPGYRKIIHPESETRFPFSGKARSAYAIRLLSIALCAAGLLLLYRLALKLMPGERIFATAAVAFVATIPQFQQLSTSISNQNLMIVLSTALVHGLICYLEKPNSRTRQASCGVLLGLCLLTRTASILYIPVVFLVLAWTWFRDKRSTVYDAVVMYGPAFIISGWWYIRNLVFFKDPLLSKAFITHQPWIGQKVPLTLDYFAKGLAITFTSFFGDLGSLQISLPVFHLTVYGALLFLGLMGFCFWLFSDRRETSSFQRQAVGLLLAVLAVGFAQYTSMTFKYFGIFLGRYLFIILAPIVLIVFLGLRRLVPAPLRTAFFVCLSTFLIVLNVFFCYQILRPAYADTLLVETAGVSSFCCKTPPINRNTSIGQHFVSTDDNLCAIRVMFTYTFPQRDGEVSFSIWEEGHSDKILYQLTYPLKKITDSQRLVFVFPPIKNSAGKTYTFSFSSRVDNGVSLWYDKEDQYVQGSRVQNGNPLSGDLYFSAYCFTGETPETIWQGIAPAVINQKNYITIGELQFYLDLTPEIQKQTVTHEKLGIITSAIKSRKAKSSGEKAK